MVAHNMVFTRACLWAVSRHQGISNYRNHAVISKKRKRLRNLKTWISPGACHERSRRVRNDIAAQSSVTCSTRPKCAENSQHIISTHCAGVNSGSTARKRIKKAGLRARLLFYEVGEKLFLAHGLDDQIENVFNLHLGLRCINAVVQVGFAPRTRGHDRAGSGAGRLFNALLGG